MEGGGDRGGASTSPAAPRIAGATRSPERGLEQPPTLGLRGDPPRRHLDLCGPLSQQPEDTDGEERGPERPHLPEPGRTREGPSWGAGGEPSPHTLRRRERLLHTALTPWAQSGPGLGGPQTKPHLGLAGRSCSPDAGPLPTPTFPWRPSLSCPLGRGCPPTAWPSPHLSPTGST